MSVGGRVIETREGEFGVEVLTWELGSPHGGYTATQIEDTLEARMIEPGDSFWWQQETAYWTPRHNPRAGVTLGLEVRLKRTCDSYTVTEGSGS